MNREILFRGKVKNCLVWVCGHYTKRGNDHVIEPTAVQHDYGLVLGTDHEIEIDTLGQYTGLKYVDGERLFEGDIIKYEHQGGRDIDTEYINVAVEFKEGMFVICDHNKFDISLSEVLDCDSCMGIIGNIHDNSELLNVHS